MSIDSQNSQVLAYLKSGYTLTPLEALDLFKCWRLGARVRDLRELGHQIKTEIVKANGKRFARYFLDKKKALAGSPEPFPNALATAFNGAAATGLNSTTTARGADAPYPGVRA